MSYTTIQSSQTAAQSRGAYVSTTAKLYQVVELGIDVHGQLWVVKAKIDGSIPEATRQFKQRHLLLEYIRGYVQKAQTVYSCYEAGATGYDLHRQLEALGVRNYVIAPEKLDTRNKGTKTDRVDTEALLNRLDCYVKGNQRAFTVIRVPTLQEEMRRHRSRQRDDFHKALQAMSARGRSLGLLHGMNLSGPWWRRGTMRTIREWAQEKFAEDREVLATFLRAMHRYALECRRLEPMVHQMGVRLAQEYQRRRSQTERRSRHDGQPPKRTPRRMTETQEIPTMDRRLPAYFGSMTAQILDAEVCNWERFENVRQVGGFFGLVPTVYGSGGTFLYGSISKHGNPRLRVILIELAWRMVMHQRGYWAVRKWWSVLQTGSKPRRKKAVVAIARCLAVDLWRWKTGRIKNLEDLGFTLLPERQAA